MSKNQGARLAHGALCTALTVILMLMARFVPVFSVISVLLTGLPVIFLGTRYGAKGSAIAVVASILVLALVTGDFLSAVLMGALHLLPGFGIGYAFSHRKGYLGAILYGSVGALAGLLLQILTINLLNDGNGFAEMITATLKETEEVFKQVVAGMEDVNRQEMLRIMTETLELAKERFLLYLPSMLIAMATGIGYAMVAIGVFMLRRVKIKRVGYLRFSELIAPRSVCYLSVLLSMAAMLMRDTTVLAAGVLNLSLLIELFLAVCGLSLIDAKLGEKISSGYGRTGIYVAAFLVGYLFMGILFRVLSLLGMIDGLFGFRIGKVGGNHGEEK